MRLCLLLLCLLLTATAASAQSLEQQGICAKQAKVAFEEYNAYYNKLRVTTPEPLISDYATHYNAKLNKCFVSINTYDVENDEAITTEMLMDAFERRVYANYGVNAPRGQIAVITCNLFPTIKDETHCTSKDEYDAFVAKYMEE
jgi:hypothetical protein